MMKYDEIYRGGLGCRVSPMSTKNADKEMLTSLCFSGKFYKWILKLYITSKICKYFKIDAIKWILNE